MHILQIHTYYQQAGGEDTVVRMEHDLLSQAGHEVGSLYFHNEGAGGLRTAAQLFSNASARQQLRQYVQQNGRPDVVHVHNLWYAAGPDVLQAVKELGLPLVQTLHNYRQVCLNGLLLREGKACTLCQSKTLPMAGILHKCNRGSAASSAAVGLALAYHKLKGSFTKADVTICLTQYQKDQMLLANMGYRPEQLVVKPNFYDAPSLEPCENHEPYFLFVGRLSEEKGAQFLPAVAAMGFQVKVAGTGPLEAELKKAAQSLPKLELLGWQNTEQVLGLMHKATALLLLSTWNEGLPMVMLQAYAVGLPVVCTPQPNLQDLVLNGHTGWWLPNMHINDWAGTLAHAAAHTLQFRQKVQEHFLNHYTPDANLKELLEVYRMAIEKNP